MLDGAVVSFYQLLVFFACVHLRQRVSVVLIMNVVVFIPMFFVFLSSGQFFAHIAVSLVCIGFKASAILLALHDHERSQHSCKARQS